MQYFSIKAEVDDYRQFYQLQPRLLYATARIHLDYPHN